MCMTQAVVIFWISGVIHYASQLALLAGFGFAVLSVMTLCKLMWRNLKGKSPYWKLPVPMLYMKIMTEFHGVSLTLVSLIGFAAGCGVTYSYMNTQRMDRERGPYKIKVYEKYDPYHALAQKVSDTGEPLSNVFKFATCTHEAAPAFDAGHTYEVQFETSSNSDGECNTFTGPNGHFEEAR
jgi:hypothetical protein